MKGNRLVNVLALAGALIIILGVGSAATEAFAAPSEAGLIFSAATIVKE